jgi:phosphopantetheine--protein transferase-like protein
MATNGMSYLPYSIERAEQFSSATPNASVCIRCQNRLDADEHMIAFDIEVLDEDGQLLQRMEKVQLVGHRSLTVKEKFPAFEPRILRTRRLNAATAGAMMRRRGLTLDTLVDAEERVAYDRLISQRRKGEWLAARVAMKTLVADWIRDFTGTPISPTELRIRKDERKAPYIVVDHETNFVMPAISITHSGGVSVAAIAPSRELHAIGIDLETVEARDDSFARNYFSTEELALAPELEPPALHAALWSVKESVSKALGIGLQARLEEIEVLTLKTAGMKLRATVELSGQAAEALERLGGSELTVEASLEAQTVFATATMRLDEEVNATADLPAFERPGERAHRDDVELAAVAALLIHRGLVMQASDGLGDDASESEDLSAWKR